MENFMSKFKIAASSLIVFLCLMMPEMIYGFVNSYFQLCWLAEKLAVVYLLALILTFTPYGKFKVFFTAFFCCCLLVQFCYMKYFGTYLTPYAINFILLEFNDIFLEAKNIWTDYVGIVALCVFPFVLLLFLWKKRLIAQVPFKYYPVLYLSFFGYFFYQASTPEGIFQMLFKNTCYASYNTINSFTTFFGNVLPRQFTEPQEQKFSLYDVMENAEFRGGNRNVIMVVGESTNAENMSLFGYSEKTTPRLEKYAEDDKNFVYKTAWAAAVNTLISLPMLYNIQYHPQDYRKLVVKDSNLLRLAKKSGFRVTYIELQNASVFRKTGVDSYDDLYIYDQEKDKGYKNEGEYLDFVLPQLDLHTRHFIIIHQRTIHSPYELNYAGDTGHYDFKGSDSHRINTYNNSMLFEDMILEKILRFASRSNIETYFYYISDHGEALGQNGLWGHGHLNPADLRVPFLFTMFNSNDTAYRDRLSELDNPCSYQIMTFIAEKLGFSVKIPGVSDDVCLINGRDSMGRAGILQVKRLPEGKYVAEKKI